MTKTYFLAPTLDCPPLGPIALGSIITSPAKPEIPLNPPLPIDNTLMPISEKHEDNWKHEISKFQVGRVGLWLSFLQAIIGISADAGIKYENGTTNVYQFRRLYTRTFWPTRAYVVESVMAPEVQAFLASGWFRHNVYMITGISVAVGATMTCSALRKRGLYLHIGVDGTTFGVPSGAGPHADLESSHTEAVSFDGGSDFVFAFRLREIRYTARKGITQRDFTKGALYGLENEVDGASEISRSGTKGRDKDKEEPQFELLGLAEEDVHGEEVDQDVWEADDVDGESCHVIKPM